MKFINYLLLIILALIPFILKAQSVTGKLIDHDGNALSGLQLKLYIFPNSYDATSASDGTFAFNNVVGTEKEDQLPSGYAVSDSYPNPFNPKTRIGFMLPISGNVKVNVYNTLGQKVIDEIEKQVTGGTGFIDLELNGLPNGLYIARVILDGKYAVTKKLMLMYGSTHLSATAGMPNFQLNKSANVNNNSAMANYIDSLVVTSVIIGRKTFKNLPNITSNSLNLGSLSIDRFCTGIPIVTYGGKTYNTVQIGLQCWFKENLDSGNMILGKSEQRNNGIVEKYCYSDEATNCTTFGGLYQWNEAMQFNTTPGAQGICPSGWHIPTLNEFQILSATVNNDGNTLKAIGSGSGSNTSGFSALLSGYRDFDGDFERYTLDARFWTSTELQPNAYQFWLYVNGSAIYLNENYKSVGLSVRCIKDEVLPPILNLPADNATDILVSPILTWEVSSKATSYTLQVSTNSNFTNLIFNQSGIINTSQVVTGLTTNLRYYWRVSANNSSYGSTSYSTVRSFTTIIDGKSPCPGIPTVLYYGKTYNTVLIGSQCWLKENLDVGTMIQSSQSATNNSIIEKYCYNNDPENCSTYGGLYQWSEAMAYSNTPGVQGICPSGWHFPTEAELQTLKSTVNQEGNSLKSIGQGTGTNTSGFSALMAGRKDSDFSNLVYQSYFWSSSETFSQFYSFRLFIDAFSNSIDIAENSKGNAYSIRCLKD